MGHSPALTSRQEQSASPVVFDRPLLLSARRDLAGYLAARAGRAILFLITAASVAAVMLILAFIAREAAGFFADPAALPAWNWRSPASWAEWATAAARASWLRLAELFGSLKWYPEAEPPEFGALAIVAGSLYVSAGALTLAVPVGLLAAVCLSDILPFAVRQLAKPVIEILAAIPSVAYGFFAVLVLAPLLQQHLGMATGTNALNAAVILAVMAIPTIVSVSEDALGAAGRELREAAYACGATRAETLVRVVVPAAHSGIIAAIILGMMRAIGETMVVWMASGNAAQVPSPWWDITQSVRTMTATIAGEMGETAQGSPHYRSLFAMGLALLAFTFVLNFVAEHFMARMRAQEGRP